MFAIVPERDQLVAGRLAERFGGRIQATEQQYDMFCATVDRSIYHDAIAFLREDPALQFNFLTTLCGMHYPASDELGLVVHLHSFVRGHRIRIKSNAPLADPVFPTLTDLWPAANWMEREAHDFFGLIFRGHPNLKRILNVEEMTAFPMRKDFPLEDPTREDKNDLMFGR